MRKLILTILALLVSNSTFPQVQENITGTWVCTDYREYSIPYKESLYIKEIREYAQEFEKYAYFNIIQESDDTYTVIANGQYKTPLFNFEEITKDTLSKNDKIRWCSYILDNYQLGMGLFLIPKYNYQYYRETKNKDTPPYDGTNPFGEPILYFGNSIVIPYNGYLFAFNKGCKPQDRYKIKGIPGVENTFFKVENLYLNNTIETAYNKFLIDFPYCASKMPKELPLNNSEIKGNSGITKIIWVDERNVLFELNDLGDYFIIEFEQMGEDVRMLYRFKPYYEDFGPDYQG